MFQVILAARSPIFVELILKFPDVCVIDDHDYETMQLLVKVRNPCYKLESTKTFQFLYSGQVEATNISPTRIIKLLGAAEKYQVD